MRPRGSIAFTLMNRWRANLVCGVFVAGPIVAAAVAVVWGYGWWNGIAWARGPRAAAIWWCAFAATLLSPVYAIVFLDRIYMAWFRLGSWRCARRLRRGLCPFCGHVLHSTDERCGGCGWTGIDAS